MTAALVVDKLCVLFVGTVVIGTRCVLQLGDRVRGPHVVFTADAEGILTARIQCICQDGVVTERGAVCAQCFFGNFEDPDTFNRAGSTREVLVDQCCTQTNSLKDLSAAVRHVGRDAHFGHHFVQAFADGLDVILDRLVRIFAQRREGFQRKVRVDRFGAIATKQREVMDFTRRAGFNHDTGVGAQAFANEMLVNR